MRTCKFFAHDTKPKINLNGISKYVDFKFFLGGIMTPDPDLAAIQLSFFLVVI